MELWRLPNASTYVVFPILDLSGLTRTGITVRGRWMAFDDTSVPTGGAVQPLTGGIAEIGTTGLYRVAIASTQLPAASPYTLLMFDSTATVNIATQYLLINTATPYVDVQRWVGTQPLQLTSQRVNANVGAMAAGVITATVVATGAIDADALATDAVNEIVDQVWDEVTGDHVTANTQGQVLQRLQYATVYLDGTVTSRATPAQVNTEVVDALNTDTYAEPAQGAPAATTTLVNKIGFLYKFLRNRITQTSTTLSVYNDDAATVDHKSTVSDDATTYDRGEIVGGP